ncbi:MAG: hypothetical protein PVJ66_00105 [Gammaproteobacteria bacterium]|jgi:hypothetical protein
MNKSRYSQNMVPVVLLTLAIGGAGLCSGQALAEEAADEEAAAQDTAGKEASAPETATTTAPARTYGYGAHRYNRANRDRYLAARRAQMEARREALERYHSARRWWNNPEAESRRLWSQARSNWYRDMAEKRRDYYESIRPDYEYGYGRSHGGPWGDYEYDYGSPRGGGPWY